MAKNHRAKAAAAAGKARTVKTRTKAAAQRTGSPAALSMLLRAEPVMRDGRSGAPRQRSRGDAERAALRDQTW